MVSIPRTMNVHTPGWVGYAGNKMYYAQNLQTQMIVAQRIDTALHVGTHFDGAMHATDNRDGDMAHLPLDYLVNRGVVVDISKHMHDWAVITPEIIESSGADIREGDISDPCTGGIATTRARSSRTWCAISATTPVPTSTRCTGCSRRRSSGGAWTPAPATTP
jgi:kynurenine formamidase